MAGSKQAAAYLALVFLLGAAFGAGGYHLYDASQETKQAEKEKKKQLSTVEWLTKELECTKWQKAELEDILDKTYEQYELIYSEIEPQYEEARQRGRDRIRAILNEDQQEKFEMLVKRIDEKERKASEKKQKEKQAEKAE